MSGSLLPYTSTDEPGSTRRAMASANASEDAQSSPIREVRARRDAHRLGIRSLKHRLLDQFQVSHGNLQVSRWAEPLGVPAHGAARTKARERPVPSDAAAKSLPPPRRPFGKGVTGPAHCAHCAPATLKQDLPHRDIAVRVVMNQ